MRRLTLTNWRTSFPNMIDFVIEDRQGRVEAIKFQGENTPKRLPGGIRQDELDLAKLTKQKVEDLQRAEADADGTLASLIQSVKKPHVIEQDPEA